MFFNKAFIRFNVFLSCPCHDRYSLNGNSGCLNHPQLMCAPGGAHINCNELQLSCNLLQFNLFSKPSCSRFLSFSESLFLFSGIGYRILFCIFAGSILSAQCLSNLISSVRSSVHPARFSIGLMKSIGEMI